MGQPIIELKDVAKVFLVNGRALTVFEGLHARIEERSFLSIVGPSGCGKSTLLKLISGLDAPSRGQIVFNGRPVGGPAKGMIYVFQQYTKSIFPWRTVMQNVAFGLNAAKNRHPRWRAAKNAWNTSGWSASTVMNTIIHTNCPGACSNGFALRAPSSASRTCC